MMRFPRQLQLLPALAALAVAGSSSAALAQTEDLFEVSGANNWGTTEFANGDKVVRGRMNTLHFVWEDGGLIKYTSSNDGTSWTPTELVAPGIFSALPAITSDSNGTLVVAFVANPDSEGIGTIEVARKEWGGSSWSHQTVVNSGTQPDIQAKSGLVHLVWTTIARVQYTQFPTTSLPSPMNFGDEVEISSCDGTGFYQPSVALARENCDLIAKIGYLRLSDERNNPDANCVSLFTQVGPRVCSRDVDGNWSLEWDNIVQATNPAQGVEAISFSMNANYTGGHVFAAWSDSTDGDERCWIAHGRNGNWESHPMLTGAHHIHVAASPRYNSADFRLAWSRRTVGQSEEFAHPNAAYYDGVWPSGPAADFPEVFPTQLDVGTTGRYIERPHAAYWYKCSQGYYDTLGAIGLFENACSGQSHLAHLFLDQPCPPSGGPIPQDCWQVEAALRTHSCSSGLELDYADLGEPYVVRPEQILFRKVMSGRTVYTRMSWSSGRVIDTWEGGMRINDPSAKVHVSSSHLDIRTEKLRRNEMYRNAKVKDICRR